MIKVNVCSINIAGCQCVIGKAEGVQRKVIGTQVKCDFCGFHGRSRRIPFFFLLNRNQRFPPVDVNSIELLGSAPFCFILNSAVCSLSSRREYISLRFIPMLSTFVVLSSLFRCHIKHSTAINKEIMRVFATKSLQVRSERASVPHLSHVCLDCSEINEAWQRLCRDRL